MTSELPESVIASELRSLRETTERNHKETTDQINKLVSAERHELVTQQLKEADKRTDDKVKELSDKFDAAEKDIKSAGRARWNSVLAAILGLAATILYNLFWPHP